MLEGEVMNPWDHRERKKVVSIAVKYTEFWMYPRNDPKVDTENFCQFSEFSL
jgi:hypothetical protein